MGVERLLRNRFFAGAQNDISLALDSGDAGGGGEFRGRYPLAAGQRAAGGAVRGDGADVPANRSESGICGRGVRLVGVGAHRRCRADRVRGGHEHLQFHGRDQWHHGRVFAGGAGAALPVEPDVRSGGSVRGREPDRGGDPVGAGVLLVQLPAEEQGEVLCGGCG